MKLLPTKEQFWESLQDPVKRVFWVLLFLVFCMNLYLFKHLLEDSGYQSEVVTRKKETSNVPSASKTQDTSAKTQDTSAAPSPEEQKETEKLVLNKTQVWEPPVTSNCVLITFSLKYTGFEVIGFIDSPNLNCTASQYRKLSIPSVSAQLRTTKYSPFRVLLPGIQIGTADITTRGFNEPFVSLGDTYFYPVTMTNITWLDMIKSFIVNRDTEIAAPGEAFYPYSVKENTYYRWNAGRKIYAIKTDKDEIYILTSYTNKLPSLIGISSLDELGNTMKLPKGWKYEVLTLTKVLERRISFKDPEESFRLMDNYQNIYLGFSKSDFYH